MLCRVKVATISFPVKLPTGLPGIPVSELDIPSAHCTLLFNVLERVIEVYGELLFSKTNSISSDFISSISKSGAVPRYLTSARLYLAVVW